jgi:hypothetical protein
LGGGIREKTNLIEFWTREELEIRSFWDSHPSELWWTVIIVTTITAVATDTTVIIVIIVTTVPL